MGKILITLAMLVVMAALLVTLSLRKLEEFQQGALVPEGEVTLWLPPGTSFAGMVAELERLGLTRADWRWRVTGRQLKPRIRAGEYRLVAGMSVVDLIEQLQAGMVRRHRFTIIEGWTVERLRAELASDPRLVRQTADWDPDELMAALGCDRCFAEGRFLPETYFFTRGDSDFDLLTRAFRSMVGALEEAWNARAEDLPLNTPDELLILASIVERETGHTAERPLVAGVFVRRLRQGMRLQTDPTVIYGLDAEEFDGRLRRIHLQTDHPWNTYTRHGLPQTPIALPGRAALMAAARPQEGQALYFVARGDGTHEFSASLADHNAAVNRYIRQRR